MPHFDALKIYSCGKHCEKGDFACNKQFLQCFLPCIALNFHFKCTLKCRLQFVSVWTCLKFCCPDKPWFLHVCSTSLLKKLRATSNFSFFHSVFFQLREFSAIFIKFEIVVCKLSIWNSSKFVCLTGIC